MSLITLAEAKNFLNVIHSGDDSKIQMLLDGAEDEALQFMNRDSFDELCECDSESASSSEPSSEGGLMPASVKSVILFLLEAAYEGTPQDMENVRQVAETKLMPYRCRLGV